MASYTDNGIYTYIRNAVMTAYPSAYVTNQIARVTEQFPCVRIAVSSKTRIRSAINFANDDEQYRWTYRIEVFTNKENGGITQARAIMDTINTAMRKLGFADTSILAIENIDVTINRLVGTFSRIICGSDVMPSST